MGRCESDRRLASPWCTTGSTPGVARENVLAEILRAYPHADLFALVDFLPDELRARLGGKRAQTTFLQRMPGARRHFRGYLPLFPRAIESLDLSRVRPRVCRARMRSPRACVRCRGSCTSATATRRCAMRGTCATSTSGSAGSPPACAGSSSITCSTACATGTARPSDARHRVHRQLAVHARAHRALLRPRRGGDPPAGRHRLLHAGPEPVDASYYFTASRWVPYKRIDLIVAAFRALPERRLVIAGDGPGRRRVRAAAGPNVEFAGEVAARADARAPARRARVRVRGGGRLRHPARRGAGLRHAGDRLRPRRRPRDGACATDAHRPASSSRRRRRRRSPTPCSASRRSRSIPPTAATQAERFATPVRRGLHGDLSSGARGAHDGARGIIPHGPQRPQAARRAVRGASCASATPC